jgi:hypothetical protein
MITDTLYTKSNKEKWYLLVKGRNVYKGITGEKI